MASREASQPWTSVGSLRPNRPPSPPVKAVLRSPRTRHVCRRPDGALAWAWGAGVPIGALWLALTALDGRTYHLAPALVTAAPAIAARLLGLPAGRGGPAAASLAVAGVVTVTGAWACLELAGMMPTATLWRGQPGGVRAEIVVAAVLGVLAGALGAATLPTGTPPRRVSR